MIQNIKEQYKSELENSGMRWQSIRKNYKEKDISEIKTKLEGTQKQINTKE